jgi:hypothetical protein
MSRLPYIDLVPDNREAFASRLEGIASSLGINPAWLMIIFYIETAASKFHVIDHRITNSIGAVGLIQFLSATARGLGTTPGALKTMSNVQQLEYVFKYLLPYKGRMKSLTDTYLAVLFPVAIGKPDQWVLQARNLSAREVARWNPLYDLNRDMEITVGEIREKLKTFIPSGYVL